MNVLKFMLATFFAICIAASVTACQHTDEQTKPITYEGFGKNNAELLVPVIRWAF